MSRPTHLLLHAACCLLPHAGVEKKSTARLQDARTVRKIVKIDEHICLAFSGLTADARVLINRARVEAQSYRLTLDEKITVDHLTKYIAGEAHIPVAVAFSSASPCNYTCVHSNSL